MKYIYGYDFVNFVELMEPFVEDGAVKHIYIEKLFKPESYSNFNVNVVLGDLSDYNKSFEITCGDDTVESRFLGMMHTILSNVNPKFTQNGIDFIAVCQEEIDTNWEVLL